MNEETGLGFTIVSLIGIIAVLISAGLCCMTPDTYITDGKYIKIDDGVYKCEIVLKDPEKGVK